MNDTITLPTSAFLGNFEKFTNINTFPLTQAPLTVQPQNPRFVSLHPVISAMIQSLNSKLTSPYLEPTQAIKSSEDLEHFFSDSLDQYHLSTQDILLVKYMLAELTRNTIEHARDPRGSIISLSYGKKSHTLRLGIVDRGIGIKQSINLQATDYNAIITALTPGVTGTTQLPGGSTQNAGAGLFFVKSLAHQLGSHFLLYSGTGLFKLLKRKTKRNILHSDSTTDHASGGNNHPFWQGTVVGVDIPLDQMTDFNVALSQIRKSFYESLQNQISSPSTQAQFIWHTYSPFSLI